MVLIAQIQGGQFVVDRERREWSLSQFVPCPQKTVRGVDEGQAGQKSRSSHSAGHTQTPAAVAEGRHVCQANFASENAAQLTHDRTVLENLFLHL